MCIHMCECKGTPPAQCSPPPTPAPLSVTPAQTQTASMVQSSGLWTSASPRTPRTMRVRPVSAYPAPPPLYTRPLTPGRGSISGCLRQPAWVLGSYPALCLPDSWLPVFQGPLPHHCWVQLDLGAPGSDPRSTSQTMSMRTKTTRTWSLTPLSPWSWRVGGRPLSLVGPWNWNPE